MLADKEVIIHLKLVRFRLYIEPSSVPIVEKFQFQLNKNSFIHHKNADEVTEHLPNVP